MVVTMSSQLQQNSDNELPHDNSNSGDGREVSGSSKAKRRRVGKHSTGCDSAWVRRWEWLRPVCGSSHTVVGLLCHLCQKHSIQCHAKSHQHAGSVAKEHSLLQSGDIGCILSSETRKQISRNTCREAVVGALRSLYFLVKHSLPHTTLFGLFLDFCILQGCEYLPTLHLAGNAHHQSESYSRGF